MATPHPKVPTRWAIITGAWDGISRVFALELAAPGWLAKLLITSLAVLPRRARTMVVGEIMAGMAQPGAQA